MRDNAINASIWKRLDNGEGEGGKGGGYRHMHIRIRRKVDRRIKSDNIWDSLKVMMNMMIMMMTRTL